MRNESLIAAVCGPEDAHRPGAFIYYQIHQNELAAAVAAVQSFQARWRVAQAGREASVWRRPGTRDGQVTLMEIYLPEPGVALGDAFEAQLHALDAEVASLLRPLQAGQRHVEVFTPCA